MPGYQHILLEKVPDTHIARLILNRPEKRNPLNDHTMDQSGDKSGDALEDVEADDSVLVLMVSCFGGTWLRPKMLGSIGKAAEPLFTGDFREADEAYRPGFLNKLASEEDLEKVTLNLAAAAETVTLTSKDHLEGTAAIREARKPVYGGG